MEDFDFKEFKFKPKTREQREEDNLNVKPYRMRFIPIASTILETVALMAIAGLLTIVQFNGKYNEEVTAWMFILYLSLRLMMLFLSKDVAARTRVDVGQTEKEHLKIVQDFKDAAKNISRSSLNYYIKEVANPQRKVRAWKAKLTPKVEKISAKIERLSIKYRIAEKLGQTKKVEKITKKVAPLGVKKDELLYQLSDEFIEKNLDLLKVRYNKVAVNQFFVSDLSAEVSDDKCAINVDFENRMGIARSMPISAMLVAFTTLVGLDSITFGSFDVLTFCLDVLSVSFYMGTAWLLIGSRTLAKQRKVLENKTVFLEEYSAYEKSLQEIAVDCKKGICETPAADPEVIAKNATTDEVAVGTT